MCLSDHVFNLIYNNNDNNHHHNHNNHLHFDAFVLLCAFKLLNFSADSY